VSAVAAPSVLVEAGIEHVSPSSLNRFIRCPENFRQRYLLGIKDVAGAKALQGTADHEAYADYFRGRIAGSETPLDVLEDVFRGTLHARADEYDLEGSTADALVDSGIPMVRAYYKVAQSMPDPVSVEQKVLIERPSLPIPILGYLDVKFPNVIVDRKRAATRSVHPEWRLANRVYSAAESLPAAWHIVTATKTPAVYTPADGDEYQEPWSEVRAQKTIRMCGQIMASIEACLIQFGPDSEWPTTGLSHAWACGKCPYRKACPAWT
jgi:hypothetical protein